MASSLPRPHTGRTARRLQNQNKLLQLLESNHHSVQNAALSAGISELQCGRQNEGHFRSLFGLSRTPASFSRRELSGNYVQGSYTLALCSLHTLTQLIRPGHFGELQSQATSSTHVYKSDREVLRIDWRRMAEIVKLIRWLCAVEKDGTRGHHLRVTMRRSLMQPTDMAT
jgi:hypothetical protein